MGDFKKSIYLFLIGLICFEVEAQSLGVVNVPQSLRLIVKYKTPNSISNQSAQKIQEQLRQPLQTSQVQSLASSAGIAFVYHRPTALGGHVIDLPSFSTKYDLENAVQSLRKRPDIEYVEVDALMQPASVPNDPSYISQWNFQPVTNVNYGADFQTAWNTSTGNNVTVAIIDTGILPHPDLVGSNGVVTAGAGSNLISSGYDFITDCRMRGSCPASQLTATAVLPAPNATDLGDFVSTSDRSNTIFSRCAVSNSSWHGTHVSGTIAALSNNGIGVAGGAYNAKILPVRALGKCGGYTSDVTDAMLWAGNLHPSINNPNPAKIINMSLGGNSTCGTTYQNIINRLYSAGVSVVVAAGNSNADTSNFQPASCSNVITVAAIGKIGARASYSNFDSSGRYIAIAAQGGNQNYDAGIISTLNTSVSTIIPGNDGYAYYQGTSMATPHVAAAIALMLANNPQLTTANVRAILTSSSSVTPFPVGTGGPVGDCTLAKCGAGILNANLAVQNSRNVLTPSMLTLDYGVIAVNLQSNLTINYTNTKVFSSTQATAAITGAGASAYQILGDTCSGQSILPSGTCTLTVRYSPTSVGNGVASLTLPTTSNATVVALTAWAGSKLRPDATSKSAATVGLGSSTRVTATFTNVTGAAVTLGGGNITSPIMAISTDNCSLQTIASGATCSVTVTVSPVVIGAYAATLSLNTNGSSDIAHNVDISGTAIAAPPPTASAASGGGGGGCTVLPAGMNPDLSLALYALIALVMLGIRKLESYTV